MEYPLTKTQQAIFDLVESTNDNIYIGGKPGVGKSVLINALTECGQKHYTCAAPTGLAAINITTLYNVAKTLHSLFMIPTSKGILGPDYNKFIPESHNVYKHLKYSVKHLIIDEISMVRCDQLDYIERCLRYCKGNDLPFGGVQIIAVGDFFQLPPIVSKEDRQAMIDVGYKSEFAFDAFCFKSFKCVELNEVLRQKGDIKFLEILHAAREGSPTAPLLKTLNERVQRTDDIRISLCGKNSQAEEVNNARLRAIKNDLVEFHADSFGTWPAFPAETILNLKIGAQVMVKRNGADRPPGVVKGFQSQVVNGTLGIVVEICERKKEKLILGGEVEVQHEKVAIKLRNGTTVSIFRQQWQQKEKVIINGEHGEKVTAGFEQIPLSLAWAISMHKSQGQSFEAVHVDPSSIFAAGQLYVALSRARSLAGLSLASPCTSFKFWANKRVKEFYSKMVWVNLDTPLSRTKAGKSTKKKISAI